MGHAGYCERKHRGVVLPRASGLAPVPCRRGGSIFSEFTMGFRKMAFLIIATLACGSAALAGGGGRGVAGPNRSSNNGVTQFFIVRVPLPIRQAPASTGPVGFGASNSRIDSRIDSRINSRF
jgi:hypothetical protein